MAAIDLKFEGAAPGRHVHIAKVTIGALAGNDVQFDAQETLAVFNVPANCFVIDVFAYTRTAWTASVTLNVGDGVTTNGWLATAKVAPTSAQTNDLPKRTSQATADVFAGGKLYAAADTIDVIIGGATPVVGVTDLYVLYTGPFDDVNL